MSEGGQIVDAGLGDPPVNFTGHRVIIERPQIYPRSKGNPNDLITLAIQVGRYTERLALRGCAVEHVLPHTWKGSLDPDICCRRIYASLTPDDLLVLNPKLAPLARKSLADDITAGTRHNVIDAVGIAKWSIKRARAGVF